jgi:hypothetical protein
VIGPYIQKEQIGIKQMGTEATYLKAILSTVARQAFPPDRLAELVMSNTGGKKQLEAFNMCDGNHTQSQIAESVGLDKGNFSRSMSRWIDLGIVIRVGDGTEAKPVHVYPLSKEYLGSKRVKKNGE